MFGLVLTEEWDEEDEDREGVWSENEAAVHAFLEICTQFRAVAHWSGAVQRIGLDYGAVRSGLELAGINVTADLWSDIRIIEAGVVTAPMRGGDA